MSYKLGVFGLLVFVWGCSSYKVPMVPSYQQIPVIQVRQDDTLYSLAKRYDTTVEELIEKNNIADPTALKTGQDLTLPKPIRVPIHEAEKMQQATSQRMVQQSSSQAKTTPNTTKTTQTTTATKTAQTKTTQTTQTKATQNTKVKTTKLDKPFVATGKVQFAWPVKGAVLAGFGVNAKGIKNDGINIAAAQGTAIKSAEAGIVVYAGNELKGYGNLILIKHEKDFMTAYAHAEKMIVKVGQVVAKGDKIATVGTTGNVKTPQVHFEIRLKTKSVDPKKYLQ